MLSNKELRLLASILAELHQRLISADFNQEFEAVKELEDVIGWIYERYLEGGEVK